MASEKKILEAIFGTSIPTDQAAILPEIMAHIRAIDDLLQGKPRQYHKRISDPAISGPINRRISELYAEVGKDWPKIAAAICLEFNVTISPDACRGRHKDAVSRQEAYAALSGSAIQADQYTTPPAVIQTISESVRTSPEATELPKELPVPSQQVTQRPDDRQIEAIKAEAIKLYQEGGGVKCIAEKLGVRWQWVQSICARSARSEPPLPKPEKKAPLNLMDAQILEMVEQGAMVHEICLVIGRNYHQNLSTTEMAEKIRKLQDGLR